MLNNNKKIWIQDPKTHQKAKLPSGRTIQGVKNDAKKYKKEAKISHSVALDFYGRKNGLGCIWNDFVLRTKELIGVSSCVKETKIQEFSPDTLIMGDSGSGKDRIALQQLSTNLSANENINDWVIDLQGDNTIWWYLSAIVSLVSPDKNLRVMNYISSSRPVSKTHFFNLSNVNNKEIIYFINSLFSIPEDRNIVSGIVSQLNSKKPFHDLKYLIEDSPSTIIPEENKERILSVINSAIESELFDIMSCSDEKAWSSDFLFDKKSVNCVLLPSFLSSLDSVNFLLEFYIKLISEKVKSSPEELFRVTILGMSSRNQSLPDLISNLKSNGNVEIILSSNYPFSKTDSATMLYDHFLKDFNKSICLKSNDYIPNYISCLESTINDLNFGEAVVLNGGKFDGKIKNMPCLDFGAIKLIHLFHADGSIV